MEEWRECQLGDVIELKRGYDLPKQSRTAGSVPLVSSSGVSARISEAKVASPGVVTGRYGTIGQVFFIEEPFWPLNTTLYVRDFKGNDPRFIGYFLGRLDFMAYSDKAAVPGVNRNHLHQATVRLPARKDEQVAIAGVLSALDDKIELTRRMNETLEASARALFRDWLVDFGPTRSKAEGRPAYLAPDLWSLFPDRLGDDGLPVGWRTGVLSDIIDVSPAESLKRGVLAPYLDMAALPTSGPNAQPAVQREYASGTRFRNGDTLLARITPCLENGKTAFVQALPENTVGWGSTEFIVLRAIWPVPECVPYLIARDDDFRRHAIQSMTGTSGRQRASADAVTGYPIALPPDDRLWRCLSPALDATFERIARNAQVSQALANTRDGLLPKLMSGELRVREAEALAA